MSDEVLLDRLAEIRGAVARGWCAPECGKKEMDVDLAEAIARSVVALLDTKPAPDVVRDAMDTAVKELRNIVNAKRFDRPHFANDSCFADWAQSRAEYSLGIINAAIASEKP